MIIIVKFQFAGMQRLFNMKHFYEFEQLLNYLIISLITQTLIITLQGNEEGKGVRDV